MVCLLYTAFHLQQSRQITSQRARSRCTRDQLASDSVCLIVASITHFRCESPEDFSILVLLQSTTTDHRTVAECTLDSPYSANKITMQSKTPVQPLFITAPIHQGRSLLAAEVPGAPFDPVTFPRPFDTEMSRRTPFVSMILVVGDQLYVYLLSSYVKRI